MTFGVVARADQSGLAQLSEQVIARTDPDRVLVVDMGVLSRGHYDPYRYDRPGRRVYRMPLRVEDGGDHVLAQLHGFFGDLDHAFTAETWYSPVVADVAAQFGARRHLYAMPELYRPNRRDLAAEHVWLPCPLGPHDSERFRARVLPWFSPTDVEFMARPAPGDDGPVRFVHPTGSAMADRNGTKEVLAACAYVDVECELLIVGLPQTFGDECTIGKVHVRRIPRVDRWLDLYALGDVLVLPRRYGWLSLPMYEAAAAGMPVITTDVWPQNGWFADWPDLLVPTAGPPDAVNMKGGSILVHTAHPQRLGQTMARMTSPGRIEDVGFAFRRWAEDHDWRSVAETWKAAFA